MSPSDEVMLYNVRYYTNHYKLQSEDFVPREVRNFLHSIYIAVSYKPSMCTDDNSVIFIINSEFHE